MSSVVILALLVAMGLLALRLAQASRLRRISLQRIVVQAQDTLSVPAVFLPDRPAARTFPRRYYYAPPLAALLVGAMVFWGTDLPEPYAVASGILIAAIVSLVEVRWSDTRILRIESQLADTIDLMVASLRAGSALLASLEAALREARAPIRPELEAMVGRIRIGEDPRVVVKDLAVRVPLESFRLFAHCLLVHWETGGSLASSLRTVGRTVRDRLEVSRRISAQAVESQISVIAVMGIAYGLTIFMLNTNPESLRKLIYSVAGSYIAAAVMILQAIGMTWIWRMSRIRF